MYQTWFTSNEGVRVVRSKKKSAACECEMLRDQEQKRDNFLNEKKNGKLQGWVE